MKYKIRTAHLQRLQKTYKHKIWMPKFGQRRQSEGDLKMHGTLDGRGTKWDICEGTKQECWWWRQERKHSIDSRVVQGADMPVCNLGVSENWRHIDEWKREKAMPGSAEVHKVPEGIWKLGLASARRIKRRRDICWCTVGMLDHCYELLRLNAIYLYMISATFKKHNSILLSWRSQWEAAWHVTFALGRSLVQINLKPTTPPKDWLYEPLS